MSIPREIIRRLLLATRTFIYILAHGDQPPQSQAIELAPGERPLRLPSSFRDRFTVVHGYWSKPNRFAYRGPSGTLARRAVEAGKEDPEVIHVHIMDGDACRGSWDFTKE